MNNPYESDELLNQYLGFHYGANYFGVPNYAAECARICLEAGNSHNMNKALDLGCAVGRSTFELAKGYKQVVGVDYSTRFIDAAKKLQGGESLQYLLHEQGELTEQVSASLQEHDLQHDANRIQFEVGDACQLAEHHQNYDLVFAGNLIDRVQNPRAFLKGLTQRINTGGLLIISSPYTLLTEYTPRDQWLGGFQVNGQRRTMQDGINDTLKDHFKRAQEPMDVPFVIRETSRKYQHSVAELTIWKRLDH